MNKMTEADWRAVATWDAPKPPAPELIPGLPGVNRQIMREWCNQEIAYRMCQAERLLHGIPNAN